MAYQILQRILSQMFSKRKWGIWPVFLVFWWLLDGGTWARNTFLGLIAKTPNIFYISMLVFFATHPIFIPVLLIAIIFVGLLLYDLGDWFLTDWNKKIVIHPGIKPITDKKRKNKMVYGPTIGNNGSVDIKDCFVDLERVCWVPINDDGMWESSQEVNFSGRLGWLESALQSRNCKRDLEGKNSGMSVKLVEFENGKPMVIKLCDEKFSATKGVYGEIRALIRVGGMANEWSIRPIYVMVKVSQYRPVIKKGEIGVLGASATVRRLKKPEDFNIENQWEDSIHKEQNEQKIAQKSTKRKKSTMK